jgi:hypothetical protein
VASELFESVDFAVVCVPVPSDSLLEKFFAASVAAGEKYACVASSVIPFGFLECFDDRDLSLW